METRTAFPAHQTEKRFQRVLVDTPCQYVAGGAETRSDIADQAAHAGNRHQEAFLKRKQARLPVEGQPDSGLQIIQGLLVLHAVRPHATPQLFRVGRVVCIESVQAPVEHTDELRFLTPAAEPLRCCRHAVAQKLDSRTDALARLSPHLKREKSNIYDRFVQNAKSFSEINDVRRGDPHEITCYPL